MKKFIIKETQLENLLAMASTIRDTATFCQMDERETLCETADEIDELLFQIEQFQEVKTKDGKVIY